MTITTDSVHSANGLVIRVVGEIDIATSPALGRILDEVGPTSSSTCRA